MRTRPGCRFARLGALCTIAALVVPQAAATQSLERSVSDYVAPYVDVGDFAGVVLLADSDGVQYHRGSGRADLPPMAPPTLETRFRIGSVSKQFTAAAILLLAEEGFIGLHEPLDPWFPDYDAMRRVTPHQLLTHTAGVPDIYELPAYSEIVGGKGDPLDVVGYLAAEPLRFEPGSSYAYSNGGYIVLARLVEVVSGRPFAAFIAERLLMPLGLVNTGSEPGAGPVAGQAVPYDPSGRDGVAPTSVDISPLQGAGSMYSSGADLYEWLRALYEGRAVSTASWEAMTTDHGNGYGYGVSVYSRDDRPVVGHDGRVAGGISDVSLFLDDGSAVVVVGNVQTGVADEFRRDLYRLLTGSSAAPRLRESVDATRLPASEAWKPSGAELDALAGSYRFHPGLLVHAVARGGRLFVQANEGAESELVPMEPGTFFSRMLYANVGFEGEGDDRSMIWREAGNRWVGTLEARD